jgi:hypothetical protein
MNRLRLTGALPGDRALGLGDLLVDAAQAAEGQPGRPPGPAAPTTNPRHGTTPASPDLPRALTLEVIISHGLTRYHPSVLTKAASDVLLDPGRLIGLGAPADDRAQIFGGTAVADSHIPTAVGTREARADSPSWAALSR